LAQFEIHISDVRTFKQCRRKWDFSSPLRHNLEPAVPYAPFFTGRAIHYATEMYYSEGIPLMQSVDAWIENERTNRERLGRLWPVEEEMLREQEALIRGMLEHYEIWIENQDGRWKDDDLQFLALETEFQVPLYASGATRASPRIHLAGRFDGLVMRKDDGSFWLWETKTARAIETLVKGLANDPQTAAYIYAAQQLFDVKVVGVLYNILRKKVPSKPRVLQNGTLSKNKAVDTTAQYYAKAVKEQHPDWTVEQITEEYGDILKTLIDEGNQFFRRVPIYRTPYEIANIANDIYTVGLEMTRPSTPVYPNESWINCNMCQFRAPCLAMSAGADYEFILEHEYQERIQAKSWRIVNEENE
jgi:hypothetical protein